MGSAETLTILILGIIGYQLYLLLKIVNKTTETFTSEEEHSTLYPVFTSQQIRWAHDLYQRAQKRVEGRSQKSEEAEQEELLAFKRSGKPVEEFKPSAKLLAIIKHNSEGVSDMQHHFVYKEKMIEANITALNGTSIKIAREEALKYSYLSLDTQIEHFNSDLARRREYWRSIYDSLTGAKLYAKDE